MGSDEESILIKPLFDYSKDGLIPYRPTTKEILTEWIDAINFISYPSRGLTALYVAFHFSGLIITILFFLKHASLSNLLFVIVGVCFLGIVYNTVWYHRYCSHASFHFRKPAYALFFLWTNPFVFREECYAIPHRIHHQKTEKPGDPYGPHLGWLGSYLAIESSQKLNINMSEKAYGSMASSVGHIGIPINPYATFRRTGSIETTSHYVARVFFAHLLWGTAFFSIGGVSLLLGWYTSIFLMAFIIRDFNWRGHGGNFRFEKRSGWEFDTKTRALNQHLLWSYGRGMA
jgi:sn-1 stearoyl-lipid 9-desaturase